MIDIAPRPCVRLRTILSVASPMILSATEAHAQVGYVGYDNGIDWLGWLAFFFFMFSTVVMLCVGIALFLLKHDYEYSKELTWPLSLLIVCILENMILSILGYGYAIRGIAVIVVSALFLIARIISLKQTER